MEQLDKIDWLIPSFTLVAGKTNEGKTYFTRELVQELLKKKFEIYYVVNSSFEVEKELAEQAIEHKNVFIVRARDLEANTLLNLKKLVRKNDKKKLMIVDNFTYQLSLGFLNFTTFSRKYNTSVIFITHTLFANEKISPRLRESVSYFVFFYLPMSDSYKRVLKGDLYDIYQDNIQSRSFKFMILDFRNSGYLIDKLPHFKFHFDIIDQKQTGEVAKALKEMMDAEEDKLDDKTLLGRQLMGLNQKLIDRDTDLKLSKTTDAQKIKYIKTKAEKQTFMNAMKYDQASLLAQTKQEDKLSQFLEGMAADKNKRAAR